MRNSMRAQPGQPRVQPAQGRAGGRMPGAPANSGEYTLARQRRLVEGLARTLGDAGCPVQRFETHLSWVLVAGDYAYKIKKAIQLPFLDFSTLDSRQFYCHEECRLNRRLAPDLYLDVAALTGDQERPELDGAGVPLEYAVRMAAFEQDAVWTRRLASGALGSDEVDALALRLAQFHQAALPAPAGAPWGTPGYIAQTVGATFAELDKLVKGDAGRDCIMALRKMETSRRRRLFAAFRRRRSGGMIRECHGDLHCGNIVTRGGDAIPFDGIEFNDGLRWIDVMDDLAFIYMDLAFRGRADLAARLLSRYLEATGDYDGLVVLSYYRMHRALVRAKVLLERSLQDDVGAADSAALRTAAECYLWFARGSAPLIPPAILVTHGYAGSGKTTFSRYLVQVLGAVHIRSDVERKRLHGVPTARGAALYSPAATRRTYERLAGLARTIVASGWPVIVDAAFLRTWQRDRFRALAAELSLPLFLFDLRAPPACMRERIAERQRGAMDASDAGVGVLEYQRRNSDALSPEELAGALVVDSGAGLDLPRVRSACMPVLARFGMEDSCHDF